MKLAPILFAFSLMSCPAFAGEPAQSLDLSPPEPAMFANGSSTPYRNDPPGTYYGDTTGVAGASDDAPASRCPTAPDGSERSVTGSATVGMGWSSRGGSSQYRGLDLNYCKDSYNDEGESRLFNASIHIDQVEGDGYGAGRRGGYGGPPRGAPRRR